ncbi:20S proteasome subunit beta 6 [Pancytospora philotis]|nr:20S proteasome subunit beta 6 [Pancytospora philotis]
MFDFFAQDKQGIFENTAVRGLDRQAPAQDFTRARPELFKKVAFEAPVLLGAAAQHGAPTAARKVSEADVYEDNSGTSLIINVDNKLIIASDTRHSAEYTINSRSMSRIFRIGNFFLATTGFYADSFKVYTMLRHQIKQYERYGKMSLKAAAHLLHNIMYARRFFPFYSYACIAAVEDGVAGIYSYDPIGSYEYTKCRCNGSSAPMIQPLLDSRISGKNFKGFQPPTFEEAVELVKKAFDSAAETDVKTKDAIEMYIVDGDQVTHEFVPLRAD